jgi:ribosomal protein S18 acetylase RimI-like enzyme
VSTVRLATEADVEAIASICSEGWRTEPQHVSGAREQWVSVEAENLEALAFYGSRGFQRAGEAPAHGKARTGRMRRSI